MKMAAFSRRQRVLVHAAPFSEERAGDRIMRATLFRARKTPQFSDQQNFDRAIAGIVKTIPMPPEISEWFTNENLIPVVKKSWRQTAKHPAIVATCIALTVIAGVMIHNYIEHRHDFPGSDTGRRLLSVASSSRLSQFDPVQTEAEATSDLFFMKYRLEHYDVPGEFAKFRTTGVRVFDAEDGKRVAQIATAEKRIQLFLFPAERDPKTGHPAGFTGWRFIEHEGWVGAAAHNRGVNFMAAMRGRKKDLAPYVPKDPR